jgi:hypothetical protein
MSRAIEDFRAAFRRVLDGNSPIDTVQAVHKVKSKSDLIGCLDVYCRLFDPDAPPKTRGGYEFARAIGEVLFLRALELSDPANGLLELVLTMPGLALASRGPDSKLKSKEAIYSRRYAILDAQVRSQIDAKAKKLAEERKAKAAKAKLLLDYLEEEYKRQKTRAHKSTRELLELSLGTPEQRKEFEKLAIACDRAWVQKSGKFAKAVDELEKAFADYASYLDREILQPIDLFRVLAWAREPSDLMQVVTVKDDKVYTRARENRWNAVWIELYTEAAWRGLKLAVTKWNIDKMFTPKGYVGKDAAFIELAFDAYGARLLRKRLELAFKSGFTVFNKARRKAALGARRKGIELFDELMTIDASEMVRRAWRTAPLVTMRQRIRYYNPRGPAVHNQTYWINFRTPGAFTVVWVYDWNGASPRALLELDTFPGFLFRANAAAISSLNQDAFFRELGENATALGAFLIAYLQVLGFALDIISAGASGSLAQVLVNYASNYLVGAATEAAMDIIGIENPWARMAIGTAVGFVNLTPNIDAPKLNIPVETPHVSTGRPGLAERGVLDTATPPRETAIDVGVQVKSPEPAPPPSTLAREQAAIAPPAAAHRLEHQTESQAKRVEQGLNPPVSGQRATVREPPPVAEPPGRLADRPTREERAFTAPATQRRLDAQAADQAKRAESQLAAQAARKQAAQNAASVREATMQAQGVKRVDKAAVKGSTRTGAERPKAAVAVNAPSAKRYKTDPPKAAPSKPKAAKYKPETAKPKALAEGKEPVRRDPGRPAKGKPNSSARQTARVPPGERGTPVEPPPLSQKKIEKFSDLVDNAQTHESDLRLPPKEERHLPNQEANKTAAFSEEVGHPVFSGDGRTGVTAEFPQRGVGGVDPKVQSAQTVSRYESLAGGHAAESHGMDNGVPGSYYAHHAEVKDRMIQIEAGRNGPTGVSKPMCPQCRLWHQRVAHEQKQSLEVVDELYSRRFNSDGSVDVYYGHYGNWPESQIGTLAAHVEPGVPPSPREYSEASVW